MLWPIKINKMKTAEELQKIGEEVVEVICEIYDPEIPVNIYALGLIYDVQVSQDCDVNITMTLTSPNIKLLTVVCNFLVIAI